MIEKTKNLNKIKHSYLNSFGIVNQFIELTFSNNEYEEIKFFVDCKIDCSDNKLNESKSFFDTIDEDVSALIYFIKANRKDVSNIIYSKEKLSLIFSNNYEIYFGLSNSYDTPLSITFKEKINEDILFRIDFEEGDFNIKTFD